MKKLLMLLALPLCLTACKYGEGETVGYIYATDDTMFTQNVWFKTTLEASESDCYRVDDEDIFDELKALSGDGKVRMNYSRNMFTFIGCSSDIVTSIERL